MPEGGATSISSAGGEGKKGRREGRVQRVQCTRPGPSFSSTRGSVVYSLVRRLYAYSRLGRRGTLCLLTPAEFLASVLLHAHRPVLHEDHAVHWQRKPSGFDKLVVLSQSGLFNHPFYVKEIIPYLQFSNTKREQPVQSSITQRSFTDRSYSNKGYCSFATIIKYHWKIAN